MTARAVGAGLAIALLMCALLPYNDYYIAATYTGSHALNLAGDRLQHSLRPVRACNALSADQNLAVVGKSDLPAGKHLAD